MLRTPAGAGRRGHPPFVGRDEELDLLESLYGRVVREGPPAPRHARRPGRRRQVAHAARARDAARGPVRRFRPSGTAARCPTARGSSTGRSARSSGTRPTSATRDSSASSPGASCRAAMGERTVAAARGRGRADRPPRGADRSARRHRARPTGPVVSRSTTRRRCASAPPAAALAVEGLTRLARRSSPGRTFTGPTTGCSTWSSNSHSGWGPLPSFFLTREELLERRPRWSGGRRNASSIFLAPLAEARTRELVAARLVRRAPGGGRGAGRRARGRQPLVRRGDGPAASSRRRTATPPSSRHRPGAAGGAPRLARAARAAVVQDAAVVGDASGTARSAPARREPGTDAPAPERPGGEGHRRARARARGMAGDHEFPSSTS